MSKTTLRHHYKDLLRQTILPDLSDIITERVWTLLAKGEQSKKFERADALSIPDRKGLHIAGYLATDREVSIDLLLHRCLGVGHHIWIPKGASKGLRPLENFAFRGKTPESPHYGLAAWTPGTETTGPFGIRQPIGNIQPEIQPDIWLVPGIAFDHAGTRLGHGKGIYDRLLQNSTGLRLGICPHVCYSKTPLPRDIWDIPMHGIVTEEGMYWV